MALAACSHSSIVRLPANQPITHEEYIKAYEQVKPDNEPVKQLSAKRKKFFEQQRVINNLTEDEAHAIYSYTVRLYYVNQDLRKDHPSESALVFAKVLDQGLNKLPKYKGVVYRNIWPFAGYKERYKKGALVTEKAFTSTSQAFGDGPMMSPKEPIRFIIESLSGRNISAFSAYWKRETEILFKTNTNFFVSDVLTVNNFKNHQGEALSGLEIHMKEIE